MMRRIVLVVFPILLFLTLFGYRNYTQVKTESVLAQTPSYDWPQLQHDPQRSGYTDNVVNPPYKLAWYKNFQPERVSKDIQAIICNNKVFVPTQSGNLYALAYNTGNQVWKYSIGSAVVQTASCEGTTVVVAALDGSIHAVNSESGQRIWLFTSEGSTGFTTSPVVAQNTVFIGERGGLFYALDLATGVKKWSFDAQAPINNSAAYNEFNNQGMVYFCDESLEVHALNSQTGVEVWKSPKLYGQSCKQYHPVVYDGFVIIRTMSAYFVGYWQLDGFSPYWYRSWDTNEYNTRIQQYSGFLNGAGPIPQELLNAQDSIVNQYVNRPYEQTLYILNESDGKQAFIPPHFAHYALPGPPPPPAVDKQRGGIIIPWIFIGYGWARLDLNQQKVVDIILPPNPGNSDETLNPSIGGDKLFVFHTMEGNAAWTGIFDWSNKQFYPFNNYPGLPFRMWQLTNVTENGNNAVSIANGYFYHIVFNQIAAWTTQ